MKVAIARNMPKLYVKFFILIMNMISTRMVILGYAAYEISNSNNGGWVGQGVCKLLINSKLVDDDVRYEKTFCMFNVDFD